jgi:hypothetical protein
MPVWILVWLPAAMERGRARQGVRVAVMQGARAARRQAEAAVATPVWGGGR